MDDMNSSQIGFINNIWKRAKWSYVFYKNPKLLKIIKCY